ncbi:hypothetical protein [Streptomyces showdoensis]|uniref:hypothetical protein n=1 Tax=Streptomyces showdoensis TaxID=68268 RepID=UPI0013F4F58A|nr:hypothetical protein [Streptomyces showdoensis]
MPESTRPVSRDEALAASVEGLVILGDAAARDPKPNPERDEIRDAFTRAAAFLAR